MAKKTKAATKPSISDPVVLDTTPEQLAACAAAHPHLSADDIRAAGLRIRTARDAQVRAERQRVASLDRLSDPSRAPAERWQRGAEPREESSPVSGRPVQRSDSGLAQLRRANKVGDAEVVAAARWRTDYELGECGARDPDKAGSGGGVDGYNISAIDALTRYRAATVAVGRFGDMLLRAFVSDCLSLTQISQSAEAAGWSRQDLTGAIVAVIMRLAEHYAEIDNSQDLPPWERSRVRDERRAHYASVWKQEVARVDAEGAHRAGRAA